MSAFNVGDVVMLKSGGPSMTVDFVKSEKENGCVWFSGDEVKRGVFPDAALQKTTASWGPSS